MTDHGGDHRERRIAPLIMGAVFVAVIIVGVLWQRGRQAAPDPPPPPAVNQASPLPKPPEPPAILDRSALIQLYAQASGPSDPAALLSLVGRRFELDIPFLCEGSQPPAGLRTEMAYEGERRSLTLIARPTDWTTLPLVQSLPAAARPEYVEGFWISRPWIGGDGCPPSIAQTPPALPTPTAAETLGVALVAGPGDPRTDRRAARPYQVTKVLDGEDLDLSRYRLRLAGQVAAFADGAPVKCWAESPDHRPVCIVAVTFERVSILDRAASLASWPR